MATKNIVPRDTGEGGLGTSAKHWLNAYVDNIVSTSVASFTHTHTAYLTDNTALATNSVQSSAFSTYDHSHSAYLTSNTALATNSVQSSSFATYNHTHSAYLTAVATTYATWGVDTAYASYTHSHTAYLTVNTALATNSVQESAFSSYNHTHSAYLTTNTALASNSVQSSSFATYNHSHSDVTSSAHGFMTDTQYDKLQSAITSAGTSSIGFTLQVMTLMVSTPTDGAINYFGNAPVAPTTAADINRIYVPFDCTAKIAKVVYRALNVGDTAAFSIYFRKNNSTAAETLIDTKTATAINTLFSNDNLNITMSAGSYFEIRSVYPTWATTNPQNVQWGGYIYFE